MKYAALVGLMLSAGTVSGAAFAQEAPTAPPTTDAPAPAAAPSPAPEAPTAPAPGGGFAAAGAPSAEPEDARPPSTLERRYPEASYPSPAPPAPTLGSPDALEKPPTSSFEVRPATVEAHLGAGTPVGTLGMMFDYLLVPNVSLAGGFGFGSGPKDSMGMHGAAMVRLRPAVGVRNAFVIGAGLSTGNYRRLEWIQLFEHTEVSATWAHFAQVELAWERRAESGFLIRVGGGFAYLLNPGALRCKQTDYGILGSGQTESTCDPFSDGKREEILPVFDIALGHSF